jgi:hypothetical protein
MPFVHYACALVVQNHLNLGKEVTAFWRGVVSMGDRTRTRRVERVGVMVWLVDERASGDIHASLEEVDTVTEGAGRGPGGIPAESCEARLHTTSRPWWSLATFSFVHYP